MGEQETRARDDTVRPCAQRCTGVGAGSDSACKQHGSAVGDRDGARQKSQCVGRPAEMTARLTSLGDEPVGTPLNRASRLVLRAHHDEDENASRSELVDQLAVITERHNRGVDVVADAYGDLASAQKRGEQVDSDGATRCALADAGYRLT